MSEFFRTRPPGELSHVTVTLCNYNSTSDSPIAECRVHVILTARIKNGCKALLHSLPGGLQLTAAVCFVCGADETGAF